MSRSTSQNGTQCLHSRLGAEQTVSGRPDEVRTSKRGCSGLSKADSGGFRSLNPRRTRLFSFLSFILPAAIFLLYYAIRGVSPFGDLNLVTVDLRAQYIPFLAELREKLLSGESLFFSWRGALGSNFYTTWAYYLVSPLNLLVLLFPVQKLADCAFLIIVLKIGLAGLSFHTMLRRVLQTNRPLTAVAFSTSYALSNFVIAYAWNLMWMDGLILLPCVVSGLIRYIRDRKPLPYVAALTLALILNYYTAFFIGLFAMFFLAIAVAQFGHGPALERWKTAGRVILMSVLAVLLSAFILLPVVFGLSESYASVYQTPSTDFFQTNAAWTFLQPFLMQTPSVLYGNPNIYAGLLPLLLTSVFLARAPLKKGVKWGYVGLLSFLFVSFLIRPLDNFWHGFHHPIGMEYRYAFLFVFLLLLTAWQALPEPDGARARGYDFEDNGNPHVRPEPDDVRARGHDFEDNGNPHARLEPDGASAHGRHILDGADRSLPQESDRATHRDRPKSANRPTSATGMSPLRPRRDRAHRLPLMVSGFLCIAVTAIPAFLFHETSDLVRVLLTLLFITAYVALLWNAPKRVAPREMRDTKKWTAGRPGLRTIILFLLVIAELTVNLFYAATAVHRTHPLAPKQSFLENPAFIAQQTLVERAASISGTRDIRMYSFDKLNDNDAKLLSYDAVSAFDSNARRATVAGLKSLGYRVNGYGNAITSPHAGPLMNGWLGMAYGMVPDRWQIEAPETQTIAVSGNEVLVRHEVATPFGFFIEEKDALHDAHFEQKMSQAVNPLDVQNQFARDLFDGDIVYRDAPAALEREIDTPDFTVSPSSEQQHQYAFKVKKDRAKIAWRYAVPEDGRYLVFWYGPVANVGLSVPSRGNALVVPSNRELVDLGELRAGEVVELSVTPSINHREGSFILQFSQLDRDVFKTLTEKWRGRAFRLTSRKADAFTGTVEAPGNGYVFFPMSAVTGWSFTVNDRAVTPLKINDTFYAVPVTSGHTEIRATFVPPGFTAGLMISLVSLAACLIACGVIRTGKKRRRIPAAQPSSPKYLQKS